MQERSGAVGEDGRGAEEGGGRRVLVGLGRALGGALLFGLPMLMTMELWQLGFTMERWRLALLLALSVPLLVGVAHRIGFAQSFGWREDLRDAFLAFGIGIVGSAAVLLLFGVLKRGMPADEIVGKVAIQAVPAALGALLGRSQFGGTQDEEEEGTEALSGYAGTLFLMLVGALFLGINVAPTDEMVLISFMMTPWHGIALVATSILLMHGFVFALDFHGGHGGQAPWWSNLLRFTLVGYVIALAVSLYVLWTFGRTDGAAVSAILMTTVVLAFPAAIGAAAARLIL